MAKTINPIKVESDTFAGWVSITNQMASAFTYEAVTVESSTSGSGVAGNGFNLGILGSTQLAANTIRGWQSSSNNVNTYSELKIGFANSSVSSNVKVQGLRANLDVTTLNINAPTINVNSTDANVHFTGNVYIDFAYLDLDSTSHDGVLEIHGANTYIHSNTMLIESNTNFNATTLDVVANNFEISGSNLHIDSTETHIDSQIVHISSNLQVTTGTHYIQGNVNLSDNTLFIDTINDRIGIGHDAPDYPIHAKYNTANGWFAYIDNVSANAQLKIGATANTVMVVAGENDHICFQTDDGTNGLYIASNGNVGVINVSPSHALSVTGDIRASGNLTVNNVSVGTTTVTELYVGNSTLASLHANGATKTHTTTNGLLIDAFNVDEYDAAKFTVSAQNANNANMVQMVEISTVYGFGNVHSTEYGQIWTSDKFVEYSANANSTHVRLYAAPINLATANVISYKVIRTNLT